MKVIDKLILGYLDQSLTEEELAALSQWVESSDANAEYFTKWAVMDQHTRVLLDWHRRANAVETGAETLDPIDKAIINDTVYQQTIQEAVARKRQDDFHRQAEEILEEEEPQAPGPSSLLIRPDVNRSGHRVIIIPRAVVYAAAMIVVATIAFFAINTDKPELAENTPPPEPAPAVPTYGLVTDAADPVWSETSKVRVGIGDSLRAGRYELAQGGLELTLDRGATVLIDAPSTFTVIDNNTIYLSKGKCVATAPPSAQGFTIRTGSADFVDIGTQFGVSVVAEEATEATKATEATEATEAHVFQGIVDAYFPGDGEQAEPMRLTEHTAVRAEAGSGQLRRIDAEPQRFGKSIKELLDRLRTSGQVYALYSPAENLAYDRRRDGNIEVFRERAGVVLQSDLQVSFLGTGLRQKFLTPDPPILPAQTVVDSYFIHYNVPRDQLVSGLRATGEVHFDQPIIALIYNNKLVFNSNRVLGAVGTDYGTKPIDVSGLEGLDYPHGVEQLRDEIEVSEDRMSIRLSLQLGDTAIGGDNIRVLTASEAP